MPAHDDARLASVLSFARVLEETMAWIYGTAAQLTTDPEVASALVGLQEAETQHATAIGTLVSDESGVPRDVGEERWTVSRFLKAVIPELDLESARHILATAWRLERDAGRLYRQLATEAPLGAARDLAMQLAALEEVHRRAVGEQFAALTGERVQGEPGIEDPIDLPTE